MLDTEEVVEAKARTPMKRAPLGVL
jgi:hypothetical protein